MEPVSVAAGALITQVVKSGYAKWLEGQTESLALSDDAKAVLTKMQSDPTNNGIFRQVAFGSGPFHLIGIYGTKGQAEVTNRVMAELEAKGLVTIEYDGDDSGDLVKLSHFGWILNPETGKADKVG